MFILVEFLVYYVFVILLALLGSNLFFISVLVLVSLNLYLFPVHNFQGLIFFQLICSATFNLYYILASF